MTGIQVKGCCIPDCRSGDGGRVYYVDQGGDSTRSNNRYRGQSTVTARLLFIYSGVMNINKCKRMSASQLIADGHFVHS